MINFESACRLNIWSLIPAELFSVRIKHKEGKKKSNANVLLLRSVELPAAVMDLIFCRPWLMHVLREASITIEPKHVK